MAFTVLLDILSEKCIFFRCPWTSVQPYLGTTWSSSHVLSLLKVVVRETEKGEGETELGKEARRERG